MGPLHLLVPWDPFLEGPWVPFYPLGPWDLFLVDPLHPLGQSDPFLTDPLDPLYLWDQSVLFLLHLLDQLRQLVPWDQCLVGLSFQWGLSVPFPVGQWHLLFLLGPWGLFLTDQWHPSCQSGQ